MTPVSTPRRAVDSTVSMSICPRCEEGVLTTVEVPHDLTVAGSVVRIPHVQAEECRRCGFRSLSGREVRLFDILFAPQYADTAELIRALRAAAFHGMFLKDHEGDAGLGFGSREYVAGLAEDLRELYLDNESGHVIDGLTQPESDRVTVQVNEHRYTVKLPKIGEGENGIVFDYEESPNAVFKVAKPRPYSRSHLVAECEITDFFAREGVPVPRIVEWDRYGAYVVKERLAGESLAVVYDSLGGPETERHRRARAATEDFITRLIALFERYPGAKTSVSPNNIFIVEDDHTCRCLLVDTGPAPFHDYSKFDFDAYWTVTVPQKIKQYRAVGFIK